MARRSQAKTIGDDDSRIDDMGREQPG